MRYADVTWAPLSIKLMATPLFVQRFFKVMAKQQHITVSMWGESTEPMASSHKGAVTLHWRHNDHDGVSNHQPHGCLLNRLFRPRSKKTSKLCVTGLCAGNSRGPVNSPHKWPVTRKMFPSDDVIMNTESVSISWHHCLHQHIIVYHGFQF